MNPFKLALFSRGLRVRKGMSPLQPASLKPPISYQVRYPLKKPSDILDDYDSSAAVLSHPALVVTRQIEVLNVLMGYEQANKYAIKNMNGLDVGYIAEENNSIFGVLLRQILRNRRPFDADILDQSGKVVLKIHRPIKWFLNSHISVSTPSGELIGEVKQVWHLWRRQYELFLHKKQFAAIDSGFLSWDFHLKDENENELAAVNRNFVGFARELFTDSGQYAIHMDALENKVRHLSLDERAVLLACAINIDIDYFSRQYFLVH